MVRTIAEAVHYAHQQGVLHRDLKPSNILIDNYGEPRITDFGLAKQLQEENELTQTGHLLGSPNYMSPEQASGNRAAIGPSSDIYALGAVLYELLTSRPPFAGKSITATLRQVLEREALPRRADELAGAHLAEPLLQECCGNAFLRRLARLPVALAPVAVVDPPRVAALEHAAGATAGHGQFSLLERGLIPSWA